MTIWSVCSIRGTSIDGVAIADLERVKASISALFGTDVGEHTGNRGLPHRIRSEICCSGFRYSTLTHRVRSEIWPSKTDSNAVSDMPVVISVLYARFANSSRLQCPTQSVSTRQPILKPVIGTFPSLFFTISFRLRSEGDLPPPPQFHLDYGASISIE